MEEITSKRSRNGKVFDLGGGQFRAEIGNHSHTLKNGLWIPTDTGLDAEAGNDADTGLNYILKSRGQSLDYDIKFGKNDPVWMKIKHIPTGKKVTFKPKQNKNNPGHTVVGNKISVSQAWDGIDMEIFVSDFGVKTNYIITSTAGQRIVEFDLNGDIGDFRVGNPWYKGGDGFPVNVSSSLSGSVLSYDFTSLPVGTIIDPTVTSTATPLSDTTIFWSQVSVSNPEPFVNNDTIYMGFGAAVDQRKGLLKFDVSAIPAGVTVTSATLQVRVMGNPGSGSDYFTLHRVLRNWVPAEAWWQQYATGSAWQSNGAAGALDSISTASSSLLMSSANSYYTLPTSADMVADVTAQIAGTSYGWVTRYSTGTGLTGWASGDNATAAYRPLLTVDYTDASAGGTPPGSFNPAGKQYPFGRRGWK